jgi:hypothetical protein
MWPKLGTLALAASLISLGACAQSNAQINSDGGGPSPDARAKMDAARDAAKTSAFADLSDDHRAKVQTIVDAFDATGSTMTIPAASSQIDAVLGKDEIKSVLGEEQKMRDAMRAAFADAGAGPPGGGSGSSPGGGGPGAIGPSGSSPGGPGGFGVRRRTPDAGRFLLSIDATPDRYREEMRAERAR